MTLTSVPGIKVGHAVVPGGGSGCTAILGPFRGAVEVRGMATGTRELEVLSPYHLVERVHAVLLTGGSAFGLSAAQGVMEWLAERGEGFETGAGKVPLVPAAVIFDLKEGRGRPGPTEGRGAAEAADGSPVAEGPVGAGTGATVGKLLGPTCADTGGVGSTARLWGGGTVGALAVVNAMGDVVDRTGSILAGARREDGSFVPSDSLAVQAGVSEGGLPGTNTTLIVVATDLPLSRTDLGRVAKMAATALPRAITPVNTPFDGDLVFSLSSATESREFAPEDVLAAGIVARDLVEEAIRRAVSSLPNRGGATSRPESGGD